MQRTIHPQRLTASLAIGAMVLVACGDDATAPAATQPDDTIPTPDATVPPTDSTTPADQGFDHPTGANEAVVEITYEGGFVPVDYMFTQLPILLVGGDGRQYVQGPQIEIYPQPLLPNVQVSAIGESGIQALLDLAAEHGLLTQRAYEAPTNIADAPDTVVTIHANGDTYEHRAYTLGLGTGGETGDRAELAAFVEAANALGTGESQAFAPDTFLVRARPVDDLSGFEIEPTLVDWPADAPLRLADASECAAVVASDVSSVFTTANQLTFFVEAGVTYQLSVKPQLPGDGC